MTTIQVRSICNYCKQPRAHWTHNTHHPSVYHRNLAHEYKHRQAHLQVTVFNKIGANLPTTAIDVVVLAVAASLLATLMVWVGNLPL